ncbi:hypothetical protein ACIRPX_00655 [Streptomyces sp. NPDC101225]|uniref:hypothetical protein n=1 Tax=Streptomyces sp. NPDC101225 TaxID=3366135 RepID=UPI003812F268
MTAECALAAALLVYAVPSRTALTPGQNAGADCVWCAAPVPPDAGRDLGGHGGWSPHGCPACHRAQRAWVRTYMEWAGHVRACPTCRAGCSCGTGTAFQGRLTEFPRRADLPPVVCARCEQEIGAGERFEPHVRAGGRRPRLGYVHAAVCPGDERRWPGR